MLSNLDEMFRAKIKLKKVITHNSNLLIAKSILLLHSKLSNPRIKRMESDNLTKLILNLMLETFDLVHRDQNISKPTPENTQYDFTNKWFDTDKLNQGAIIAVDMKNITTRTTRNKFLSQWTIRFIIYSLSRFILI